MLTKEQLTERLLHFRERVSFKGDDRKFWEFISINFDMDSFFLLNVLSGNEILEFVDNHEKLKALNQTLSELIDKNIKP